MGGAQRYVFDLASTLAKEHEVAVAFGEQGEKGELAQLLREASIKYFVIKSLKRNISPLDDYRAIGEIADVMNIFQPEVVHLNSTKVSIVGSLAARKAKARSRVVYTAHGWVFKEPMNFLKKWLYVVLEKYTACLKDRIICISKVDLAVAKTVLDISDSKLALIYHGLNQADYHLLDREAARHCIFEEMLNIKQPENAYIVGSIGNLYPTKDFNTFVSALAELRERTDKNMVGVIMGDGPERAQLEIHIRAAKAKVYLIGRVMDAANYLKAFDCYVCSSVKEGFPYTILEAMSAEVPIISTRVGGIPDIIEQGVNGQLVEAGDYKALAQGVIDFQAQPEVAGKYASNSKDKQAAKLSLETMIKDTLAVYNTY